MAQLKILERNLDRIYRDRLDGPLEEEDFLRIYSRYKAEKDTKQRQLTDVQENVINDLPDADTLVGEYFDTDFFKDATLLHQLIERIEFSAERRLIINFRCRVPGEYLQ